MKHTNNCLTFITDFDKRGDIYGKFNTAEVREHCKNERVNFDSMRFFIPFVTVTWFNDKGRIHLAVINQSPVREPHLNEWIATTVSDRDVDEFIRRWWFLRVLVFYGFLYLVWIGNIMTLVVTGQKLGELSFAAFPAVSFFVGVLLLLLEYLDVSVPFHILKAGCMLPF